MTEDYKSLLTTFHLLGTSIETAFRRSNYRTETLAEIARDSLARFQLSDIPMEELLETLFMADLPNQVDIHSGFGEPHVTVFDNGLIYIEVLFWQRNQTTIHEHAFGGAFQVLHGTSVHPTYHFDCHEEISSHMHLGQLQLDQLTCLKVGDVTEIVPGSRMIHSSLHVEHPTITLVVRNRADASFKPQMDYLPPHFAIDTDFIHPLMKRRLELLRLAMKTRAANGKWLTMRALGEADSLLCLRLLETAYREYGEESVEFGELLEVASASQPRIAPFIVPTLREQMRTQLLLSALQRISEREKRLALLLLVCGSDARQIYAILADEFPTCSPTSIMKSVLSEELFSKASNAGSRREKSCAAKIPDAVKRELLRPLFSEQRDSA